MKLYTLTVTVLLLSLAGTGQEKLPPFRIALANGTYLSSHDLSSGKPVLFVYFDPDCEACKTFTSLLKDYQPVYQKYLVLMVTNTDLKGLQRFTQTFRPGDPKSLVIGTEGWTRSLQRALGITRYPYVAIYDKNRQLVQQLTAPTPEAQFEKLKAVVGL